MQEGPGTPHASTADRTSSLPPDALNADEQYELNSETGTLAHDDDATEVEIVEEETNQGLHASNANDAPDVVTQDYVDPPRPETPSSYLERAESGPDDGASEFSYMSSSPSRGTLESLKTPLLALAAAGGLLLAFWNYSALEAARAELGTVSAAKATVDKALSDAQSRLTAAEKAVADVKAALSATPLAASPAAPTGTKPPADTPAP